ncbi:nucleoside triphosphate pyrophosphohydrolase [Candidatus Obscuribacterales bacterium]|nr:nucleoside triphosphate pyrophosphohydrolase [Candidatus Obscuribacterales bacterium]MBX3148653.1 nucleoside triphosphate pyrophosphohydrolase [Candidatus Obscuribacterales bacterium]
MPESQLEQFVKTIARLRAPDGCPWDREQTHDTLARYLLEETYEVLEAIHSGDSKKMCEELGDLLLQIVLNAQVAKDAGNFDIEDVARGINEKMIERHPHVFGDKTVDSAGAVKTQWEEIKDAERKKKNPDQSSMDGISKVLPALLQALKVSEKAVSQGFEWKTEGDVWKQLDSELEELREAISNPEMDHPEKHVQAKREVELEFGDVLFCMVNVARWHAVDPEGSLLLAIEKFKDRFRTVEKLSTAPLKDLTTDELEELWLEAKKEVSGKK